MKVLLDFFLSCITVCLFFFCYIPLANKKAKNVFVIFFIVHESLFINKIPLQFLFANEHFQKVLGFCYT